MKAPRITKAGALVVALLSANQAQAASAERSLFQYEATVTPGDRPLARMDLPDEVLKSLRADWGDLRIVDANGTEVPYAITFEPREPVKTAFVHSKIIDARRIEERRDARPSLRRETYRIVPPEAPFTDAILVLEVRADSFVAEVSVGLVSDSGELRDLATGKSVFRLRNGSSNMEVPLGILGTSTLEVVVESEGDAFLEPSFGFRAARHPRTLSSRLVALKAAAPSYSGGRTTILVDRPLGIPAEALRFHTSTPWFDREIEIWDQRTGREAQQAGKGRIRMAKGDPNSAVLDVPVQPLLGDSLRVEIIDGDSPPFQELRIDAVLRKPNLVFAVPSGSGPLFLRFGGGRAVRPSYDMARLVPPSLLDGSAEPERGGESIVGQARIERISPIEDYRAEPKLEFAQRPGATVDARLYSWRRELTVKPSFDGSSVVRLTAEDLQHASHDLRDVRIVDAENRQWPYLEDPNPSRERVPLRLAGPPDRKNGVTRNIFRTDVRIRAFALSFDTELRSFDRSYRLLATLEDGTETLLMAGRLSRTLEAADAVRIWVGEVGSDTFVLEVVDGENEAIEWRSAVAETYARHLLLTAPAGTYSLLVGSPSAVRPGYDIAQHKDLVLSVEAGSSDTSPLRPNEDFSKLASVATASQEDIAQSALVWALVVAVVIVLAVVTYRVVKSATPPPA